MNDAKRSRQEVLRQAIADAVDAAGIAHAAGDPDQTRKFLGQARATAAELKALSQRMGSDHGYDDAVRMLALIEQLQAKLKPPGPKS